MQLPQALEEMLASGDFVLFVGAGYSRDCGIPAWQDALKGIGDSLEHHDQLRAALIRQDASRNRYLEAAETFYMAELDKADRFQILQSVFDRAFTPSERQKRVAGLACQAIVTTNFDRVLSTSVPPGTAVSFTESDDDLNAARLCRKKFILRLHGRIESPDTIIFARRHYDALALRRAYTEFIRDIFLYKNVIFFGFSFADPFISKAIRSVSDAVSSVFRRKAFTLVDSQPSPDMQTLFDHAGIRVVVYEPADAHKQGWDILTHQRHDVVPVSAEVEKVDSLKRELATVYARAKSRTFSAERVQVLAGLMLAVVEKLGVGTTIGAETFTAEVRRELALPVAVPDRDIREALVALEGDGFTKLGPDGVTVVKLPDRDAVQLPLKKLVGGLVARSELRYQYKIPEKAQLGLRDVIAAALAIDGLHVAHSIIRRMPLDDHRVDDTVNRALGSVRLPVAINAAPVAKSLSHLLTHPDRDEEQLLGMLSSVAFSTSLLIEDPVFALNPEPITDAGVFLDTNIVLPWICKGHPLTELYGDIVETFGKSRAFVIQDYANEVVNHRRLAIQQYAEARFEEPARLQRYVSLFEAHGINAFLSGYAGLQAEGYEGSFDDYLAHYAPFQSDQEAIKFLDSKGLSPAELTPSEIARVRGGRILGALRAAVGRRRQDIVIEHDARQLEKLLSLESKGQRPFFITADKVLISSLAQTQAQSLLGRVLLPYQASYLGQLIGARLKPGLARAMWSTPPDFGERVRDYYIDRVLGEYEMALVKDVPEIVDATLSEIERTEHLFGDLNVLEGGDDEKVRLFRALDRFEPGFYEKMLDAKKSAGL